MLFSIDLVWFTMFLLQVYFKFWYYPRGLGDGGGWVGEIGNKANSAEAEALHGLAELGNY